MNRDGTVAAPTVFVPGVVSLVFDYARVRIVVENHLPDDTTVHWHGIDVPNAMDGVPDVTQAPIGPGDSFTYEFDAVPAGKRSVDVLAAVGNHLRH